MKRFKNILVVCDDSDARDKALDRAAWVAKSNGASVTLVDVVAAQPGELARIFSSVPGGGSRDIEEQILDVHRARLEALASRVASHGVAVRTIVEQGTPFLQVIRRVLRDGADLVIKGALTRGGTQRFGSDDLHLMRKAPCPVWILQPGTSARSSRILAAVDPDPADATRDSLAHTVMQLATSLAQQDDARLDVIHSWRVEEEGTLRHGRVRVPEHDIRAILGREAALSAARFDALLADYEDPDGRIHTHHVKGPPEAVIPAHVDEQGIDTIVMGTVGRTGIRGLIIGNTAEAILNSVDCSVLSVKPVGFVSPVQLGVHRSDLSQGVAIAGHSG